MLGVKVSSRGNPAEPLGYAHRALWRFNFAAWSNHSCARRRKHLNVALFTYVCLDRFVNFLVIDVGCVREGLEPGIAQNKKMLALH